ncbi:MAG: carbohydrate binding family 9 domain-containing protein [Acidobacteriaceae bacterium]
MKFPYLLGSIAIALLFFLPRNGVRSLAASRKTVPVNVAASASELPSAPAISSWSSSSVLPATGDTLSEASVPPFTTSKGTPPAERNAAHVTVPELEGTPKLGDFLIVPVRSNVARQMLRIGNFIQRFPKDGKPSTEPTVAYLGYTHQYFYAAFVCTDRMPRLIRAHMLARDSLGDDDFVEVMLDTFHDQRRAFVFKTNPLGIQADALFSEQNGSDYSFDTVWDTWGKRTPTGYAVLIRVPFASMYFAKAAPNQMRAWGIILERGISHANEYVFWPQNKHNVAGRLTQDIEADGFMNVAHGQNWQFEPYVLGRNLRQLNVVNPVDPYFQDKHLQGYGGLDAKFILRNSLVLDTTVNPDFSQVGIDNPATPNQRFPPYFPEVRPFFIENSSYFMTPISLYYTDNIVTPQYGARLTGKLGPWALGVLGVDDRSPGQAVPPGNSEYNTRAHFYIGRVNRDVGSLSNLGIIYADREYLNSFNRSGGFDYRARLKNRWTLTGQAISSATQNISNNTSGEQPCELLTVTCSGQVYSQQLNYSDLHKNWWLAYNDTAAGYVTDTGFFRRPDVREPNGFYSYTFRPKRGLVLSHGPSIYSERIWSHVGLPLDFYINPAYSATFKYRTSVSANVDLGQDRLRPVDYTILTHNVEYRSHTSGVNFYSSPQPYIAVGGGVYKGTVVNYAPPSTIGPDPVNVLSPNLNVEVKPVSPIDLQNSYVYTHFTNIQNGEDVYDNHELISRWNCQLTKAISFNLIGQYISTLPHPQYTILPNSKTLFADALFTYLPHPGTAIYFGYIGNFANLNRALCTRNVNGACNLADPILPTTYSSLMNDSKTIYLKLTYLLRF